MHFALGTTSILIFVLHKTAARDDTCRSPSSDDAGNDRFSCASTDIKWKWDPTSKSHPCNIHRISHSDLLRLYGPLGLPNLYPYPLVIYPDDVDSNNNNQGDGSKYRTRRNEFFANLTSIDNLPKQFSADFNVTLTGSDSLSSHRRIVPLTQYLEEVIIGNQHIGFPGETLPYQLGNETWYLFGETFTSEWANFLQNYQLPSCHSCTELHYQQHLVALSFGIGNIGSGVQWHLHGPGFSETIHGRKHWVLYPPQLRPEYDLNYASRHWMENVYPVLDDWNSLDVEKERHGHVEYLQKWKSTKQEGAAQKSVKDPDDAKDEDNGPSNKKPWECTIHEGEMIYFPDGWHHATINLESYTVFVSSFTSEHVSTLEETSK
ncbi:hypothetical protein HJC23_002189 [Cyclotella cryptica]|uniref:JmjC domain-containing protein n=1 Tax=Cyclotella cryptica TaxID=29204 RepID=A0ABD3Q6M6_9STRA|eukprot:CCRYP_008208-RA/>CCRYP_008208-RA protein AED:0.12 eAED:0.12 QI:0/-1/0/1/-1/1/1/0/375